MLRRTLLVVGGLLLAIGCGAVLAFVVLVVILGLAGYGDIDLWSRGGSSADPVRPIEVYLFIAVIAAIGLVLGTRIVARSRSGGRPAAALPAPGPGWQELRGRTLARAFDRTAVRSEAGVLELRSVVLTLDGGLRLRSLSDASGTVLLQIAADDGRRLELSRTDGGDWLVDGVLRPDLAGAVVVDLPPAPLLLSALVRALDLRVLDVAEVRVVELSWPGLEARAAAQRWERTGRARYVRRLPGEFDADPVVRVDESGLLTSVSGLWRRIR